VRELQAPQPVREDYIENAVKFLSHPKVKASPIFHRCSFLEKKGLTKEEIDEAFRRVPVRFYFSCCLRTDVYPW
jgi:peroxin-14